MAVVGAGIVGAAVARRLARDASGPAVPEVTVLEKEAEPGTHQTGHNSGVVHAGVYYAPGSDKARLSREGVRRLSAYCRERGLPYDELGKVVVALDDEEEVRLRELERRARANGVPGLERLGPDGLRDVEPHVTGRAALLSPTTAVTDFGAVARSFLDDATAAGAQVATGFEVVDVRRQDAGPVRLTAADGRGVTADVVVLAAGLGADRLAGLAGDGPDPRIVPFRGEYLRLRPEARHLVRGLVYPVPDPRYPFLGVHLTRRTDGEVLLGPNAVLATAREGYRRTDVDASQLRELVSSAGFRRFARANVRTGVHEVAGSLSRGTYVARVRRYVPELSRSDVLPAPAGVRAQAMDADGTLVEDFRFSRVGSVFCIRNAPSPAATASLAIADLVVDRLGLA